MIGDLGSVVGVAIGVVLFFGAAALVDVVCQACHEKLSALELDRLKHTEGVKRCEYCRRIVVFA